MAIVVRWCIRRDGARLGIGSRASFAGARSLRTRFRGQTWEVSVSASSKSSSASGSAAIRPFTVPTASESELEDLRARIRATRWPDKELVDDHSQGPKQDVLKELARYWAEDYDMRRVEKRLGALPNFVTTID